MKAKSPLVLMTSFILALLLSASVYLYLSSLENKSDKVIQYDIIVANIEIPQYTKITKEMISKIKVTTLPTDGTSYFSDPSDVAGKFSGERILKGEQFFKSRILENSEGNLSLTLKGSNRALSVMANLESGVAKLVKTGDFIDIIVSLPEIKVENETIRPDISKIILQNILVLAVDQNTATSSPPQNSTPSADGSTSNAAAETIFYLTLSIPVLDVEKLTLAENIGRLKFALRPKGDNTLYPTDGAIWQEMLERIEIKSETEAPPSKPTSTATQNVIAPVKSKYIYYVVKTGDTLMNIARIQLNDPSKYKILQQINHISDPNHLTPGARIKIHVKK